MNEKVGTPLFCVALLVMASAPAGAQIQPASGEARFPLRLKDDLGYELVLNQPPQRIVSLAPSNTEILCVLGLEDRLVGVTSLCNWPPSVRSKAKVGGMVDFSVEEVMALEPDFVFAVRGNPSDRLKKLQQLGAKVFALDPATLEDILSTIERIGLICGVEARARDTVKSLRERVEQVRASVRDVSPRKRVYVGTLITPYQAAGAGTFVNQLIELAGGKNVAGVGKTQWPVLSAEQILVEDPEVVFLGLSYDEHSQEDTAARRATFQQDPIWSKTTAGRTGGLVVLDQDKLHRPGPRIVDALEEMARALYPERFVPKETAPQ